eukprot:35574_1
MTFIPCRPLGDLRALNKLHPNCYASCFTWHDEFTTLISGEYVFRPPHAESVDVLVKTQRGLFKVQMTTEGIPCCEELYELVDGKAMLRRSRLGTSYDAESLKRKFDDQTDAERRSRRAFYRYEAEGAVYKEAFRKAEEDTTEYKQAWLLAIDELEIPRPKLEVPRPKDKDKPDDDRPLLSIPAPPPLSTAANVALPASPSHESSVMQ